MCTLPPFLPSSFPTLVPYTPNREGRERERKGMKKEIGGKGRRGEGEAKGQWRERDRNSTKQRSGAGRRRGAEHEQPAQQIFASQLIGMPKHSKQHDRRLNRGKEEKERGREEEGSMAPVSWEKI